jgi:uncharacterized protein
MKNNHIVHIIATLLLVIGGLNWGLIGLFEHDLISSLFGKMSLISRTIYSLVGLSAVYMVVVYIQRRVK